MLSRHQRLHRTIWVCETCRVEHAEAVGVCAICADERQWVPADGQKWATLEELIRAGRRVQLIELEPDLVGITVEPKVGIGQQTHLVRTRAGNLLWDPVGYLDDEAVTRVRDLGDVTAIAASHPHMFGVQVEWSKALGGVSILVSEADAEWVQRPDPAIVTQLPFDRLYDNFGTAIEAGAAAAVSRSADRYSGWVQGDFDQLT